MTDDDDGSNEAAEASWNDYMRQCDQEELDEIKTKVQEWAAARKAVTDSEWKKTACTPEMVQRLASAEMVLVQEVATWT
jgi:hypothetical protein